MKKLDLIIILLLFTTFPILLFGQDKEYLNLSKKEKREVELADRYYDNYEFYLAAQEYEKVIKDNPRCVYAIFRLAESYRMFFKYGKAELYYNKCIQIGEANYPIARFWYALMLKTNGKYEHATPEFHKFLDRNSNKTNKELLPYFDKARLEMEGCELALHEMQKPQRSYSFENLPEPVNTADSEYSPTIFKNDSTIILASAREESTGNKEYGALGGKFSDDYSFSKGKKGWHKDDNTDLFGLVNTKFNESAGAFNQDGTKFYFTRCDEEHKVKEVTEYRCGIYLTKLKGGKWSNPVMLNENINMKGQWNAQPSISPNADTLFFVSKRPGGFGMHDIWYSTCKNFDDNWGPAKNLGNSINTPSIDMSPSYYSKEKTLFFASNGKKGFGGLDVYKAKGDNFNDVTTLGLPFNSNRDDFYFVLGKDKGYLASNREGGRGNDDIYSFSIIGTDAVIAFIDKDSMQNAESISVEGILFKADSKERAEDVEVLLKDSENHTLKSMHTDATGHFRYDNLAANQSYLITLNEIIKSVTNPVRYISDSLTIKVSNQKVTRNLFEGIFFDFNSYELRPEALKVLDELCKYYNTYPEIQIELDATTDNIGTDEYNKNLSLKRGETAMNYLISKKIAKTALVVNAYGKDKPLVPNKNHVARQLNRRVEFFIIGGPGYSAKNMTYLIEPKMDIYQVAEKFHMTVEELKELNNLDQDEMLAYRPLRVRRTGDNDIIAPITIVQMDEEDLGESTRPANSARLNETQIRALALKHAHELRPEEDYYIVEPQNTLYSIAKLNGMTPEEIMSLNNLKSNVIFIGQRLRVKRENKSSQDINRYVVKEGDTMVSISKKFGLTLEELKRMNNLDDLEVYQNMILTVK